ncbi:MAG: hypothetical protein IH595_02440 [Bacteroidales bacterium]|nr:hypothetical protein [Bacteroidales bacterium]
MKPKETKDARFFIFGFLSAFLVSALIIIYKTDNSFGGGDPISHYQIAHWAWKYPRLFLDVWGKPVFTILISPWAQFGMDGARIYNVVAGLISALLAWKICRQFELDNHWLAPIFVLFIPIYFVLMFTSLTEITFSLFLTLALFLFFRNRIVWSGVILSFIPLIRTEGIVLFPLFIVAFVLKKRYIAIFALFSGFLIFSIAGLFVYHNFWWLISRNPYNGSAINIYGHGKLYHFVDKLPVILGEPATYLFLIGSVILIFHWIVVEKGKLDNSFYLLLLVPGSFLIYFAAHSYAWWKGIGNSLGLVRVIGAVAPAAAITAVIGFDKILIYLKRISWILKWIVAVATVAWIVDIGITTYNYGFRISPPELLMNKAAGFIKDNHLENNAVYYFDPYLIYKLGTDPYSGQAIQWYPKGDNPVKELPAKSIIVWDAHFGPNEGNMSLEKLLQNNEIKVLKKIEPPQPFKVLGGYNYAIYIFQKFQETPSGETNL